MTAVTSDFGSLTLTPTIAGSVSAGSAVVAINAAQTRQEFNPSQYTGIGTTSGPQTGDAAATWLPVIASVRQVSAPSQFSPTDDVTTVDGPVVVTLTPPAKLAGYYSSPLTFTLGPDDFVTVATETF